MVNRSLVAAIAVGAVCCFALGWAADGGTLFDAKSIIQKNREKEVLSIEEVKTLEFMRAQRHWNLPMYMNIKVVHTSLAAFESGILTLIPPEGKEFQYIGAKKDVYSGKHFKVAGESSFVWYGTSALGKLSAGYSVSKSEVGVFGTFLEEGRQYGFMGVGRTGRKAIVFEMPPIGPME